MALVAFEPGVLAFQHVSGFFVVESLSIPLDEGKILAVVFGMAAGALLAGALGDVVGSVESLTGRKASRNFGVATQAFKSCLTTKLMTGGAVGRSVQRLVRSG